MKNLVYVLIALLAVSIAANIWQWHRAEPAEATHNDTIVMVDTVKIIEPVVRESVVVRTIAQTLKVVDTIRVHARDTIIDSVVVEIPITQKVYQDSNYIAWVSGYLPALDSLQVFHRETLIRPGRRRRWGAGLQAGYGMTNHGLSPYFGIGITYNIFGK